mgnify:CR=1 FL=1
MARQTSGQYTIQNANTSEQAVDASDVNGDIIRVVANPSNSDLHIGNDGTNAVSNTTGYLLRASEEVPVRV